ncbi:MAG: hypothetical protein GY729_04795 [Desulfobacteraceae bacterium]|nr:hypothetical protein [Desulfobacteraceae bacterium]
MFDTDKDDFFQQTAQLFMKNTQMMFKPFLENINDDETDAFSSWWKNQMKTPFSDDDSPDDDSPDDDSPDDDSPDNESPFNHMNFEKLAILRGAQVGNLYKWFMNELLQSLKEDPLDFSKENIDQIYNRLAKKGFDFFKENAVDVMGTMPLWLEQDHIKKISSAFEAYVALMNAMAKFSDKFSVPFKKSLSNFIIKTSELEKIDPVQDPKELYQELVQTLDKEYDDFLKTKEGVEIVMDLVDKLLVYQGCINDVKEIWFKFLSIPTKAEMDDIYKSIYLLKKQNRTLESAIKKQNKTIEALTRKIETLTKNNSKPPKRKAKTSKEK